MERLRAAIEQARKTRAEAQPDVQPIRLEEVTTAPEQGSDECPELAPARLDEKWQALSELTLKPRKMRRNRLIGEGQRSEQAPFDMLRTRLLTQMQKEGWRRVAVTSPTMTCGKSTTCANLALSLARQSDMRTILFEADMRRPSLAKMFGAVGKDSFFDVLRGKVDFADQAVRIGENVALSLNHAVGRAPAELLHSQKAMDALARIEEEYQPDIVIFDMPPMMNSDDTIGFVRNVDCAMLVAMAEQTTLDQIDTCERELADNTHVAGVVLNRCRYSTGQYGYGYGYGDYY